jgi:hypothetical protein
MTMHEIRLRCLALADPKLANPDVDRWVERARKLEAYVTEGQGVEPPMKRRGRPPKVRDDNPADAGPDQANLSDLASNDPVRPAH